MQPRALPQRYLFRAVAGGMGAEGIIGGCHGTVSGSREPVRNGDKVVRDSWGEVVFTYQQAPCACRQYSGPVPMPEYTAPEIAG